MVLVGILFFSFLSATLHTSVFPGYDQLEAHISINTCGCLCLSRAHMLLLVCSQKPPGSCVRVTLHKCPFRRAFVLQPKLSWILYQTEVFHFLVLSPPAFKTTLYCVLQSSNMNYAADDPVLACQHSKKLPSICFV